MLRSADRGDASPRPGTALLSACEAASHRARLTVFLFAALAALATAPRPASADPGGLAARDHTTIRPDPPAPRAPPTLGRTPLRPSWDLDGTYLWLGPTGAAARAEGAWDSTIGGVAAVLVVRERAPLGLAGGALGATLWTERAGGRVWLDAVVGRRLGGRMVGLTAGPVLELAAVQRPRVGAAIGAWAFLGISPYVRVAAIQELGLVGEFGVHLMLPVLRR